MVNIIDDDIWNAQPALRPEDEIILRKLHDMLQSTADDLKLLSGELSKHREPGVQKKSLPTPLDEEFNEKVHIEEIVNAKFHGYNIVDNSTQPTPANTQRDVIEGLIKSIAKDTPKCKKVISKGIQVNQVPPTKKSTRKNNLTVSRTRIIQIDENVTNTTNGSTEHNIKHEKEKNIRPAVTYNEYSFKHVEDKNKISLRKPLQIQNMPSINIRSELKEQKVFNLNIEPEVISVENVPGKNNISVISVQHKTTPVQNTVPKINHSEVKSSMVPTPTSSKDPIRKVSKMSSCESSESNNNINSREHIYRQAKPNRVAKTIIGIQSKQSTENVKYKKNVSNKKENAKHLSLNEWKKKLNAVYGRPASSRRTKTVKPEMKARNNEIKPCSSKDSQPPKNTNMLNNAEYIPYSKLTIGGVRVSDIEREISDIPNKNDIPLSPILDKILSRENSFHHESPRVNIDEASSKILTTSDENLLREVIEIEKKVNNSLNINITRTIVDKNEDLLNDIIDQDSYVDDFEDEKSELSEKTEKQNRSSDLNSEELKSIKSSDGEAKTSHNSKKEKDNQKKRVGKKSLNLSIKNKIDVFEYLHSVDTQETGTQSNSNQKISPKETQTSPRNDSSNVQPIHNDLWPSTSIDPKGEVGKLFELEKDFIKKLIIDEYGDILAKNLNKPSTSKDYQTSGEKNVVASQKNTQTSPTHVKSIMTSPTRTKTRTTSPFAMSLTVDKQTSPIVVEELKVDVADDDDLGISINLSSPRFSLRLPQSSREVISNLESHMQSRKGNQTTSKSNRNEFNSNARISRTVRQQTVSSSSSVDGDYSSSDISSLGEVRFSLKKKLQKLKIPSISELSSSTSHSKYSSDTSDVIIPLRSEGETSLGQVNRRKPSKNNKSEGELSLGCVF